MSETEEKKIKLRELLPRLDDKYLDIFIENGILVKEDLINLKNKDVIDLGLSIGQRNYVESEVARLKGETTTETEPNGQTTGPPEASAADSSSESNKSKVSRKKFRPKMDWSEKRRATLLEKIENFIPIKDAKVPHVNIILVGQQGSGKSSLFNTIDSAIKGKIRQKAEARVATGRSVTVQISQHKLRGKNDDELKITICDTIGIGRGGQVDESMSTTLQEGVIPGMVNCRENRMHCGVFVLPANNMDLPADDVIKILTMFQAAFVSNDIKYIVALTKIDELDEEQTDVSEIYHSEDMDNRVQEITKFFGISKNRVWPLKNYTDEVSDCDLHIDILALSILDKMLDDANCALEHDIDNESMTQNRVDSIQQEKEKKEREEEAIRQAERQVEEIEQMRRQAERKAEEFEQMRSRQAEREAEEIEKMKKRQAEREAEEIEKMRKRQAEREAEEIEQMRRKLERQAEDGEQMRRRQAERQADEMQQMRLRDAQRQSEEMQQMRLRESQRQSEEIQKIRLDVREAERNAERNAQGCILM